MALFDRSVLHLGAAGGTTHMAAGKQTGSAG